MVREMLAVAPLFGDPEDDGPIDVAALRENIDLLAGSLALPEGIRREAYDLGGVPTDVFTPDDARPGAVLYLHGGGYVIGSRVSHGATVPSARSSKLASVPSMPLAGQSGCAERRCASMTSAAVPAIRGGASSSAQRSHSG